jgi:CubicO group peptidase (beta-lactamase class C family)
MTMGGQALLVAKENTGKVIEALEHAAEFRKSFKYNNWIYDMAGTILEYLTGKTLGIYLKDDFFEPLGLSHTTMDQPNAENYAISYITLDDGSRWEIPRPVLNDAIS